MATHPVKFVNHRKLVEVAFKNIFRKRNPRGKELEDGSSSRTFNIFVYPDPQDAVIEVDSLN